MSTPRASASLDLGVIGNCSFGALIDPSTRMVWCCLPRFDGDPVFCQLLDHAGDPDQGVFAIELDALARSEQHYIPGTAILITRLFDDAGNACEVIDFAPRFLSRGRAFRPITLVRRVRPIAGSPRIRIVLRPRFSWGASAPDLTQGSNHIRFVGSALTLRLTTNAPVSYVLAATPFLLEESVSLILGPDETLLGGVEETAGTFQERTDHYWRTWTRRLALPLEWQDAVVRAAITLKLCTYEDTGAIVAAMTTSIPEAPGSGRNWDYRFCWLRDAFFVIRALNSLAEVETMEGYLRYLNNVITLGPEGPEGHLQPVYGIGLETRLTERTVDSLSGYRGMGPVRAGNQAFEHVQHDVYGNVVLAASQSYFDCRLFSQPGESDFQRLESVGERAFLMHDQPDAGMWELRTRAHVHTSSSLMCWAACDRLAKIAAHLGLERRAAAWHTRADTIRGSIENNAFNARTGTYADIFGGDGLDASVLLMAEVGFLRADDKRFAGTLDAVQHTLRRGHHVFRYANADDLGVPETAFNVCTFWYIDTLLRVGRLDEARDTFEAVLARRNHVGLLSEDIVPESGELWGNYPQTYSLVGIINAAMRLSASSESQI
jgi:GH15 family glucan-1,4-alpha-glucosidase